METTGEMNWQLLIKMISSSLSPPRLSILSLVRGKSTGEPEELASSCYSRLQKDGGAMEEQKGGGGEGEEGFRSSSGGDAVSILFVHANYSSSVTLLEIEGTLLSSAASPPSTASLSRSFLSLRSPPRPFLFPSSSIFSLALGVS